MKEMAILMTPRTPHRSHTLVLFLLALLPACAAVKTPDLLDSPEFEEALPAGKYVIQPGDDLEIRFFHTPDLNVTLPVRPDGYIALPYVRDVQASGRTADGLAVELKRLYDRELKNPEIAVIIRSFSAQQIHVGGRVAKPGVIPLRGPMTVLDSLFAAGGTEMEARLSEVVVIRRAPDKSYLVIPVDIKAVLDGTDRLQNIELLPFDAVYVPNSPIANINDWVHLYIRKNIPVHFSLRPDIGI